MHASVCGNITTITTSPHHHITTSHLHLHNITPSQRRRRRGGGQSTELFFPLHLARPLPAPRGAVLAWTHNTVLR
jgi:hypothetical protein